MTTATRREIARNWVKEQELDDPARPGFVLFDRGEICGWTDSLDRPQNWCPGVIACPVDVGPCFIADGGNDHAGAERWVPIEEPAGSAA